jgi:acetylornithine deacetylase/succinyl-diaminopimelate desuccinylase-like protein
VLAGLLRAEGIGCELVEAAPGRTSLLARLDPARPAPSITLLSHSDVVPAVRAEWDADPFEGTVRDGHVYGRGVLDLKGLGIAQLTALVLLRRHRVPLRRGVVLLVAADEEAGGAYGAHWLVRERPELLRTDLLLGEGGYSPTGVLPGGRALHAVAVAEKGYLELELTADGPAHHASMPDPDCAPARLVRALTRVLDRPVPVRLTPATERLCSCLADGASGLHRILLRHPRILGRLGARAVPASPLVAPMFTETCALTVLDSGYKSNVVPGHARAVLSMRLLPGTSLEDAADRVRAAVADPAVRIRPVMYKPPNSSPFETADFRLLARCAVAEGERGSTTPILSPAASDARHWRAAGVTCYGWVPFVLPVGDIHGVHGANERVSVEAFHDGVRRYYRAVAGLASAPATPDVQEVR